MSRVKVLIIGPGPLPYSGTMRWLCSQVPQLCPLPRLLTIYKGERTILVSYFVWRPVTTIDEGVMHIGFFEQCAVKCGSPAKGLEKLPNSLSVHWWRVTAVGLLWGADARKCAPTCCSRHPSVGHRFAAICSSWLLWVAPFSTR